MINQKLGKIKIPEIKIPYFRKKARPTILGKPKQKLGEERDKLESIIHAYAVNHYNAPKGDWAERRRVRNLALDDLQNLLQKDYHLKSESIPKVEVEENDKIVSKLLDKIDGLRVIESRFVPKGTCIIGKGETKLNQLK